MSAKKNIFMVIREAKAEAAKKIFRDCGAPHEKMADILTADELVKTFDFFARNAEINDTDDTEVAMFTDYADICIDQNLLSSESIHRIKTEVQDDFFRED